MEKSLWSINFSSNSQGFGSGIVIIDGNQVIGGDNGYYYIGDCAFSGSAVTASITLTRHNAAVVSILGNFESIKVSLSGTINAEQIQLSGKVEEHPQITLRASMRRLKLLT